MIKRYSTPEMEQVWSEENKFSWWLKIEILVVKAFVEKGEIPQHDYDLICKKAKFDLKLMAELEEVVKHDVIAFTRSVSESLGPEKKWIHYGMTSSDLVDTANSCLIKQANEFIHKELWELLEVIKKMAIKYQLTPCIGRTHGMHAEITSFGYKFAGWYDMLMRAFKSFLTSRSIIETGMVSGAVGNYANIDPKIQEFVCEELHLSSSKISSQVLARDRHAQYLASLALIASTLETICTEIRHLQRTEVGECEEGFSEGQKGSSAMPHKRNPIGSENICGIARLIRGYMVTIFENVALWHERDISHSSNERVIIPDATTVLHYAIRRTKSILSNLVVNESRMLENIFMSSSVIFSQKIMLKLIDKGWSREQAYDFIQPIAMKAYKNKLDFKQLLLDNNIPLSQAELSTCFSLSAFLDNIPVVYKRLGIA
ncbi:adenylosuccinate lyase [Mycoplasma sp. (ex Biomphalaria glabrata)]|uniref:adenylosuccinate lyase n=1 Tax=Mycoplasma sp. (ex Biomphalaria glabrata) TaxID=1749074 RepID=UPI00073AA927|nr:adenylosuccinate lyase [Mycoplasma sp. (ex Biomphalaria glabrata)]ALV23262.1 adenylosuccinate lyase [Mycoplasma sp. (ex Biomphalaria glabrata)]